MKLFSIRPPAARLAIDLGTARTRLYVPDQGIATDQPSVVALGLERRPRIHAFGDAAERMLAGDPGDRLSVLRVVEAGAVADVGAAAAFLKALLSSAGSGGTLGRRPAALLAAPAGSTAVDREALQETAIAAGAAEVHLFEQPLAAAIGAGLDVASDQAQLVAVLGAGVTEVAVVADGTLLDSQSIRIGGDDLNRAVIAGVLRGASVLIDEPTADRLKRKLGVARMADAGDEAMAVAGLDVAQGRPAEVNVGQRDVARALGPLVTAIADTLLAPLARIGPERAAQVMEHGLTLTGGGAVLSGLDQLLQGATGLAVTIAEQPALAVARGLGLVLEETPDLRLLDD